ncbi:MAG: hypothetical protein GC178_18165 [Flavobacteriales bacterium]|nr:hypothetical protein [Flavobacteriales bacterium]
MALRFFISTMLIVSMNSCFSQSLDSQIASIKDNLKQIRTIKYTIDQNLHIRSGSIVDIEQTTTDTKSRRSSVTYRLNLADIDPFKLEQVLERDMMKVLVPMEHNRRLVTELEEGEVSRYVPKLKMDVTDSEQASLLIEALKNASNTAKEIDNSRYTYTSLEEILLELSKSVTGFSPDVTKQNLSFASDKLEKLSLTVQEGQGATMKYEFFLKDLNRADVDLEAHGTDLTVVLPTNGREKLIKVYQDGLAKTFDNKVVIRAKNVENGKHILKLVELAIGAANGASLSTLSAGTGVAITKFSFLESMNSGKNVAKPSFTDQPYWCTTSNGSLNEFEKSALNTQARVTISGGQGLYYLNGLRSIKRFNGSSQVLAVIWTKGEEDPSNILSLYQFTINDRKDRREYISTKANWFGTSAESEDRNLSVSFKPLGNGVFAIVTSSPLPAGEYFFATEKFMYAFGVD